MVRDIDDFTFKFIESEPDISKNDGWNVHSRFTGYFKFNVGLDFKIYKDGTVVWTCGNIYDKQNRRKYTAKLSEQSIKKIKKLIEDNPKVFTIKEIQDRYYCATDVAYSSFYFSDGQKKNKIKVYDLEQFEDLPEECPKFSEDVRNARLLITIRKKIEKLYFKAFDKATVSPEDIYRNSF